MVLALVFQLVILSLAKANVQEMSTRMQNHLRWQQVLWNPPTMASSNYDETRYFLISSMHKKFCL